MSATEPANTDAPKGCEWRDMAPPDDDWLYCLNADQQMAPVDLPYSFDRQTLPKAESGDPEAMLLMALYYGGEAKPKDFTLALEWLRKAVEAGNPKAQVLLGRLHAEGSGVPQDSAAALRLFRAAADAGFAVAMGAMGDAYSQGKLVPRDDVEAVRWYLLAAEKGCPCATEPLAKAYELGRGAPKNPAEARRWRQIAASWSERRRSPTPDEMIIAYPVEAAAAGVTGRVLFECVLTARRTPGDCTVLDENPKGWGFTDAARTLLDKVELMPGLAVGSQFRLPIRFALNPIEQSKPTADRCAAYAIALSRTQQLTGVAGWYAAFWQARSRYLAAAAGEGDRPERLSPAVELAAQRLAQGKDRGLFGAVPACELRN